MHDPSPEPAAPASNFNAVWLCYALFAVGVVLWWPALVALLICYVKRDGPSAGIADSHYRWLISTFWWWLVLFAACVAIIFAGAGPIVRDLIEATRAAGGDWHNVAMKLSIHWSSIFIAAGVAMLGGLSMLLLWFWVIYRVVRGGLRLADERAVP